MEKILAGCLLVTVFLAIMAALNAFIAWILMIAWNYVMPHTFQLPTIDYWMAICFMILLSIVGTFIRTTVSSK